METEEAGEFAKTLDGDGTIAVFFLFTNVISKNCFCVKKASGAARRQRQPASSARVEAVLSHRVWPLIVQRRPK
ncbi:hypothetical protein [Geobacillus thermodenitrificans]|uniref:hypothetical protein n=1 Tax=Geobacillus thermodenitrificans TaxID=33940 RepID=UPI002E21CC87|nr:hypothetical protein [Geobacillus thermodenitrificans]